MKSKHTKGDWKIDNRTLYRGEEMIIDESGKYIASISNRNEAEYNAKIIAEAPNLLKDCIDIEKVINEMYHKLPVSITNKLHKLQRTIKKATE